MARVRVVGLGIAVLLIAYGSSTACGSPAASSPPSASQTNADLYSVEQIEVKWHQASSTKNLDLMMSLWADNATFNVGAHTYVGKQQIRDFFATKAAPFQPQNNWVSDTPAYKIRVNVDGDKGTLYFECHYIDVTTRVVKVVVGADLNVARMGDHWVITSSISATPTLAP
jgi:ketosteroid isomerase-like protein